MLINGLCHDAILAGEKGVFPTHDALQFGEFADHPGVQIGLCEQRGPIHPAREGRIDPAGDPGREFPETHDLFIGCSEEGMEDDLPEVFHAPIEGNLPVRLEEEPRIGEAGADHLLVSLLHDRGIPGQGVVDGEEMGEERASFIHHRKIFLVVDHRGDEHLLGKLQVFPVEIPADDRRIFGQEGHRFQELRGR
jgi:hypothetical protein